MPPATYGRNRKSIADLEDELVDLFREHPSSSVNDSEEPVIPGDAVLDVLRAFSAKHDSVDILNTEEEGQLVQLLRENPGLEVTPNVVIQFILLRTTLTPSPRDTPEGPPTPPDKDATSSVMPRGRTDERTEYEYDNRSRSSSRGSIGTSVYRPQSRPPSRPPSVPPKTPVGESPLDRRQRTQPLTAAPSSWARRPPPSRRKSDAGMPERARSDSESSSSPPPIAFSRSAGPFGRSRSRAPSDPKSPFDTPQREHDAGAFSPISIGSPSYSVSRPPSRPHSRSSSLPQNQFLNLDGFATGFRRMGSESPEPQGYNELGRSFSNDPAHRRRNETGLMSPPPSDLSETSFDDEGFPGLNTLPMPRFNDDSDSDSDSDREDTALGLVHERTVTASSISLDLQERLDAQQKANDDLRRKLSDAEDTLQRKLSEHEADLEAMQQRIEELKAELSATKRQEKELRGKERTYSTQITALEANISQLTKSLENSRQAYTNMQSQYAEQCEEAQRYRDVLLQRDEEFRTLRDSCSLQGMDLKRWEEEAGQWQNQIKHLEDELSQAQVAQQVLDEQKQENMILKETIDRLRFEIDELRAAAASGGPASGATSVKGSVSKSLGAELLRNMKDGRWEMDEEEEHPEEEEHDDTATQVGDDETDEEEEADVIQTIITRTKRKVTSRAKRMDTVTLEETKEYSDAGIQSELPTKSSSTQTDPEPRILTASFSVQTDEPAAASMSVQTDPEPEPQRRSFFSMSIQTEETGTDPDVFEASVSMSTEDEDSSASSSTSTVQPPTPKAHSLSLQPQDLPPSYTQVTGHTHDELAVRVANETLTKWHKGLKLPIEPLRAGISQDAVEEWEALKEELGIECSAIDKLVKESARTGLPRPVKDGGVRHRGGFFNIYNTYVYGDKDRPSAPFLSLGQLLLCVGASAAVAFIVGSAVAPSTYNVPGAMTYYDRAAWSSFNSFQAVGEGFPGDGSTRAFWSFLGKLGGGAARTLRGFPT